MIKKVSSVQLVKFTKNVRPIASGHVRTLKRFRAVKQGVLKVVVAQKAKLLTTRMNAYRSQCARAFTKDLHLTQDIKRFFQELNIWIYGEIRHFC